MQRHKLSLTRASETLGLSRRMVTYYKTGEKIIPRTVMLACKAVDYEPELRA
jgi:predicted transcriptional regulator